MLSLILAKISNFNDLNIIIYISVALECFLSVIGLLCYFFPEDTKFGAFLRKIFKGFKRVKDNVDDVIETKDAEDDKDE